jgi:hypothetical protein
VLGARDFGDAVLIVIAAMRADRAIGPAHGFKRLTRFVGVVENWILEFGFHGDDLA